MVPLRNALIVKEHATLLYPEGTACADVLLAGEEGGANASTVFSGMGLAAVFKFVVDGLKVIPADVSAAFTSFKGEIGMGKALSGFVKKTLGADVHCTAVETAEELEAFLTSWKEAQA